MTFEEKTLKSEKIYDGAIINLRRDKVTVQGGISYREIVEHNGGAVMAALTEDKKLIMVRQYRKPAGKVILADYVDIVKEQLPEVPAGKIDPGEKPMDAAIRELKEETGYTASKVELLTEFYPSVGYSEEKLYLYLCTGLTPGETCFDENEAIDIEEIQLDKLFKMAMCGEIDDAKTLIAILMVKSLTDM